MTDDASCATARPWPWRAAVSEGVRSAVLGRWFSGLAVLLVAWASAVPGAADAVVVSGVLNQEARFLAAGGYVMFAVPADPDGGGGVSAAGCENVSRWTGVIAAAHVTRLPEPAALTVAPSHEIAVFAVSAQMWRLLGVTQSLTRDAILSASIANRIGVRDGDWVALRKAPETANHATGPTVLRVTVADTTILGEDRTGILLPTTTLADDMADACVVSAQPSLQPTVKAAIPAALPSRTGLTVVRDRLVTGSFTEDYSARYRERPTQWAWLAAGGLLGVVWLMIGWVRRSDDALYATMGADLATRAVVRSTEWAVLVLLSVAWAIPLGVTIALLWHAPFATALTYVCRDVAATSLLATAIALVGLLRRPRSLLADLKDR